MSRASGQITASAVVTSARGKLTGIVIAPNAAGAGTVDLYDHATAALGTRLIPQVTIVATADNDRLKKIMFPSPVIFENGIYCDINATAGTLNVEAYYRND
jgi:hypothetical protein